MKSVWLPLGQPSENAIWVSTILGMYVTCKAGEWQQEVYGFIRHDTIRVRHKKGGCIRIVVMRLIDKLMVVFCCFT